MMGVSPWLRHAEGDVDPAVRLLCFPHAGGGASTFNSWRALLPGWLELVKVQLPGREDRRLSPPHQRMEALVGELFPHLQPLLDRPLVLYGHSMGAVIAFEVARALRRHGYPLPLALLISGRRAPHRPLPVTQVLHTLPEETLALRVGQLGGLPPELLGNRRWLSHYLPTIRADLCLSDDYEYSEEPLLACPIHTFIGEADTLVVREDWEAWSAHTAAEFTRRILAGGHFFSTTGRNELIAEVSKVAASKLGRPIPPLTERFLLEPTMRTYDAMTRSQ
jgi:medium-chain acyl-[acyl-carrier-protein] hydrolase